MNLIFKNANQEKQDIANVKNETETIQAIEEFCANKDYDIPYISVSYHANVIIYDVGSYDNFFYLYLNP